MRPKRAPRASQRKQGGYSLIEALVGFLILSLGMLGVTVMESHLIGASANSQQRNEAVYLARSKVECLRTWPLCTPGYDAIATGSDEPVTRSGAVLVTSWVVVENPDPQAIYKRVTLTVTWTGKEGDSADLSTRSVVLETRISPVPSTPTPASAPAT